MLMKAYHITYTFPHFSSPPVMSFSYVVHIISPDYSTTPTTTGTLYRTLTHSTVTNQGECSIAGDFTSASRAGRC